MTWGHLWTVGSGQANHVLPYARSVWVCYVLPFDQYFSVCRLRDRVCVCIHMRWMCVCVWMLACVHALLCLCMCVCVSMLVCACVYVHLCVCVWGGRHNSDFYFWLYFNVQDWAMSGNFNLPIGWIKYCVLFLDYQETTQGSSNLCQNKVDN